MKPQRTHPDIYPLRIVLRGLSPLIWRRPRRHASSLGCAARSLPVEVTGLAVPARGRKGRLECLYIESTSTPTLRSRSLDGIDSTCQHEVIGHLPTGYKTRRIPERSMAYDTHDCAQH
jgi:hypothetical protein